jgi:predicted metalloprotease with PDZ domain
LVTALDLKFIDFDEYVATLGRVYDSYLSKPDELSLIDASERRWTTGNSVVYDKGMLVAFLYDLLISRESNGQNHMRSLYRQLFSQAPEPANANDVIIKLLSSTPGGADLAKNYIEGKTELNLKPLLADKKQLSKLLGYK